MLAKKTYNRGWNITQSLLTRYNSRRGYAKTHTIAATDADLLEAIGPELEPNPRNQQLRSPNEKISMTHTTTSLVQGASRGIGLEMVRQLLSREPASHVIATCRNPDDAPDLARLRMEHSERLRVLRLDVSEERSIESAAQRLAEDTEELSMLVNVAGVLHGPTFGPEKKLGHVDADALRRVFEVNAFGPLLVAKHFFEFLRHERRSVFASLSARIGSISDNRLGGWYAYRGSKAAQNMFTKTLSIELGRVCPNAVVIGLHPGTVSTDLSKPFQRGVSEDKLFTPSRSVESLLNVIDSVTPEHTGKVFDFRGDEIPP